MKKILFTIFFLSVFGVAHADITTGLVGHWACDEGTGTTCADSSGNNNTGTQSGTPTITWIAGHIGSGAINIAGSPGNTDVMTMPGTTQNDVANQNAVTASAWVRIPNAQVENNQGIFGKLGVAGEERFLLFWTNVSSNKISFLIRNTACTGWVTAQTVNTYNDGNWHLVTGTWDKTVASGAVKIYIDGNFEIITGPTQATNMCQTGLNDASNVMSVGNYTGSSRPMAGDIDDVCLYNRALTAADVLQLFNSTGGCGASVTVIIDRLIIWAQTFINGALFIN